MVKYKIKVKIFCTQPTWNYHYHGVYYNLGYARSGRTVRAKEKKYLINVTAAFIL